MSKILINFQWDHCQWGLQIYVWYKSMMSDKSPTIFKTGTRYNVPVNRWIRIQSGKSVISGNATSKSRFAWGHFLLSIQGPETVHVMQTMTRDITVNVSVLEACGSCQSKIMPIHCLRLCTLSWAKWVTEGSRRCSNHVYQDKWLLDILDIFHVVYAWLTSVWTDGYPLK